MKVRAVVTSPFGRRGTVLTVDARSKEVKRYLDRGVLEEIKDSSEPTEPDDGSDDGDTSGTDSAD